MKNKRGSKKVIVISLIVIFILGGLVFTFFTLERGIKDEELNEILAKCSDYCSRGFPSDFCRMRLEINIDGIEYSSMTCHYLSQKIPSLGVETCPEIPCDNIAFADGEISFGDVISCDGNEGKEVYGLVRKNDGDYFLTSRRC